MKRLIILAVSVLALAPTWALAQATPSSSPTPTRGKYVAGDAFDRIPQGEDGAQIGRAHV